MSDTRGMAAERQKDTKWYATPAEARKRKPFTITFTDEAKGRLDKMAAARGISRSQVLESLVLEAPIRPPK